MTAIAEITKTVFRPNVFSCYIVLLCVLDSCNLFLVASTSKRLCKISISKPSLYPYSEQHVPLIANPLQLTHIKYVLALTPFPLIDFIYIIYIYYTLYLVTFISVNPRNV